MRDFVIEFVPIDTITAHPLSLEVFGELDIMRIEDLKEDIEERGLQYPLEVDNQNRVICGSQRLRAITDLRWDTVPIIRQSELKTEDSIREHLLKDNVLRRQLTPGQMYKAGKELERIYGVGAEERMKDGVALRPNERGDTRDRVAADLGTSASTYERTKKVFEEGSEELQHEVDTGLKSISAAAEEIRKGQEVFQGQEMPSDDGRRLTLRYGKVRRQLEKYAEYLEKNDLKEFADEPRWKDNLVYSLHDLQKIIQSKLEQLM
jgi:ParB-like chromosome segregation protein Spo0J